LLKTISRKRDDHSLGEATGGVVFDRLDNVEAQYGSLQIAADNNELRAQKTQHNKESGKAI
jgi:hypothetical protein